MPRKGHHKLENMLPCPNRPDIACSIRGYERTPVIRMENLNLYEVCSKCAYGFPDPLEDVRDQDPLTRWERVK